nr:PhoH family protein [Atopobacter sp. AH10]
MFGVGDKHIQLIEEALSVDLLIRDTILSIQGDHEQAILARHVLRALEEVLLSGHPLTPTDVLTALNMAQHGTIELFISLYRTEIGRTVDGKAIRPKSINQERYVKAIQKKDLVIGEGPAGTGKTFLAVVLAVTYLKKGLVKKIILTRPAVEAGENLGFLPGDLKEKVDPYLRPLYDALYAVYGVDHTERLLERGIIEVAPLAYMRGRTLNDAFIILDEAQNTTPSQMRMFLTRLGFGSKMVVNGDTTQIDLPKGIKSGLIDAKEKLHSLSHVSIVELEAVDVVRHPLVAEIIKAYAQGEKDEH